MAQENYRKNFVCNANRFGTHSGPYFDFLTDFTKFTINNLQ